MEAQKMMTEEEMALEIANAWRKGKAAPPIPRSEWGMDSWPGSWECAHVALAKAREMLCPPLEARIKELEEMLQAQGRAVQPAAPQSAPTVVSNTATRTVNFGPQPTPFRWSPETVEACRAAQENGQRGLATMLMIADIARGGAE